MSDSPIDESTRRKVFRIINTLFLLSAPLTTVEQREESIAETPGSCVR